MKKKHFSSWLVFSFFLMTTLVSSQNLYLSPSTISIGYFNLPVTVSVAGATPLNPLTNYTSQKVYYKWSFLGDGIVSSIYVKATTIPAGFSFTVLASSSSTPSTYAPGSAVSPAVSVTTSDKAIVTGILSTASWWIGSAKTVSRSLTQNISISDFSQVRPGTYDIHVEYSMY